MVLKNIIKMNTLQLLTINVGTYSLVVYQVIQKNFAHKTQAKHGTTAMELSIPFHTLVKFVGAEDKTREKIRSLYITLGIKKRTSELPCRTFVSLKV